VVDLARKELGAALGALADPGNTLTDAIQLPTDRFDLDVLLLPRADASNDCVTAWRLDDG
jgi:hypothetical protein